MANLIAKRKRNNSKTFGYDRAEILAAFTNGIILIVISIYLFIEGIQRFSHPEPIKGKIMLIVFFNWFSCESHFNASSYEGSKN